jgi:hypothetical protein
VKNGYWVVAVATIAAFGGIAVAQQFPILDRVAEKVVQKYQGSTCEQLWQKKSEPKSPEEQRIIGLLKGDPAMRTEFLNRVAGPIANKMFDCGMIP